jgi:uncharacterized protein with HEPN domain
MPKRDWVIRIQDILTCIQKIEEYIAGMDYEQFERSSITVDAVLRNLEIIGKAARHIPQEVIQSEPDIPWSEMKGLRNIVVHEYFGVSLPIIWHTATENLPVVVPQLIQLLEKKSTS